MTDDQAFLSPARIPGFALAAKMWAFFLVSNIRPVQWQSNAFDQLVLNHKTKSMIKSLVEIHGQGPESCGIIEGKGKGMIFLLHGPPGTGKTLTAGRLSFRNDELILTYLQKVSRSRFIDHCTF
jgi:SpoVK/Ycf46/Vps4 family AAA+-type ATPase